MSKKKKELVLEELLALPLQFWAASGRSTNRIAYVSNKTGRSELYLFDLDSREITQLTDGEFPASPVGYHVWTPDDSSILFTKDPIPGNEKNDVFSISVPEGELKQLTDTPDSRDDLGEVSHNGKWVIFASDMKEGKTQLFRMNIDGSDILQLTDHVRPVAFWYDFVISPDDKWVAYTANDSENLQNLDVWIVRIDGSEKKKLISIKDGSQDISVTWSRDGSMLLFGSDHSGVEQAGVYFMKDAKMKWFGSKASPEVPITFTADGTHIVVRRDADAEMRLLLYEVDSGREVSMNLPSGVCGARHITADGKKLIVGHQDSTHRMHYLTYDFETHSYEEIIPAEYGNYTPDDFHPDEYVSYKSGDVTIYALLYKPRELPSDMKLPAIVMPHGGPTSHYTRLFDAYSQVLADKGYIVLQPNVRGSTGYGVEFRDACLNDWGGKDLEDIEAAVAYLKDLDFVDSDRIGISGGSYGGYMTYMAVTKKPELWKAASAAVGITSIKHLYDKTKETFPALSYYLEEQMGKPEKKEVLDLWEDRSAINFADKMTAKLQIVHTENDPRCPIEQAAIFRDRLLELGRKEGEDFEYVVLKDMGHGSLEVTQRTQMFKHLVDYFDANL
ncbi:MAG: prolyl oligopeptidase family serine peptidase [Candidatus Thorarchaeota archaeon]